MNSIARAQRILAVALLACALPAKASTADEYQLAFELRLRAGNPRGEVSINLTQPGPLLREARFRAPRDRYDRFRGDGVIERDGDTVTWHPPAGGGGIYFRAALENRRAGGDFDGRVTRDWALFRADDAFPAARVRFRKGARSRTSLRVTLPDHWTIATPFDLRPGGVYAIDNPDRAFDRPTGWLLAGRLGRRSDRISGIEVSVAAPVGAGVERIAMLALLRWTLPYLASEADRLPRRLSIVAAGDPMWRGGLSAANSVYVHAERPLLSENGTSTLLHEVVHVLMRVPTQQDHDWIDEGIAEYITLRLLSDSGTISATRFRKALEGFAHRARAAAGLATPNATGAVRARGVTIIARLDAELAALTGGKLDIYDLVRQVRQSAQPLNIERLRAAARELTGTAVMESLADDVASDTAHSDDSNLTK